MGGGTDINYPQQPSYGESMRESLQAQIDLAPDLYAAESSQQYGRPAYAQLETDILRNTLLGQTYAAPTQFNEEDYLAARPDVAAGVKQGTFSSGREHWDAVGRFESEGQETPWITAVRDDPRRQAGGPLGVGEQVSMLGGEAPSTARQVGDLYSNMLGRPPDAAGLAHWMQIAETGGLGAVREGIAGSPEGRELGLSAAPEAGEVAATAPTQDTSAWGGGVLGGGREGTTEQIIGSVFGDDPSAGAPEGYEWVGGSAEAGNSMLRRTGGAGTAGGAFAGAPAGDVEGRVGGTMQAGGLLDLLGGRQMGGFTTGETTAGGAISPLEARRAGFGTSIDPFTGERREEFLGMSQFGSDVAERAARQQRAADIGDVSRYGGALRTAMEGADPLAFGLLGTMGASAEEGLAAGRGLSPRQRREAEQSARAGWEARGMIRDPEAVVSEVESVMEAGGQEEARRRAFAQQVMGTSQAMSADPFMAILGRPSGASQQIAQQGMGTAGYGLSSGPQLYSPESGVSYMLGQQQNLANLQAAQAAASATKQAGMMQGIGSMLGCWIAREVYGESNPKWKRFREWMMNDSPAWFLHWYLTYGETVAEWISDKPDLKARIRVFMDSKVEG